MDSTRYEFPPVTLASPEGLLAIGGDLSSGRLLAAYRRGIFPWYSDGQPILWWSPDPRTVLFPDRVRISRSLAKRLRNGGFRASMDECFARVIEGCATSRAGPGTWITAAMHRAYVALYRSGYAHSLEVWHDGALAGGLYGVAIGRVFFGESMFTCVRDASKVALVVLCRQLVRWRFAVIDCQLPTDHLFSLGAEQIPRQRFVDLVDRHADEPGPPVPWRLDPDSQPR
jgi:leucyl/phenylalanyl-tRNA--protein transferase